MWTSFMLRNFACSCRTAWGRICGADHLSNRKFRLLTAPTWRSTAARHAHAGQRDDRSERLRSQRQSQLVSVSNRPAPLSSYRGLDGVLPLLRLPEGTLFHVDRADPGFAAGDRSLVSGADPCALPQQTDRRHRLGRFGAAFVLWLLLFGPVANRRPASRGPRRPVAAIHSPANQNRRPSRSPHAASRATEKARRRRRGFQLVLFRQRAHHRSRAVRGYRCHVRVASLLRMLRQMDGARDAQVAFRTGSRALERSRAR